MNTGGLQPTVLRIDTTVLLYHIRYFTQSLRPNAVRHKEKLIIMCTITRVEKREPIRVKNKLSNSYLATLISDVIRSV